MMCRRPVKSAVNKSYLGRHFRNSTKANLNLIVLRYSLLPRVVIETEEPSIKEVTYLQWLDIRISLEREFFQKKGEKVNVNVAENNSNVLDGVKEFQYCVFVLKI